jgi:hypothetical protein
MRARQAARTSEQRRRTDLLLGSAVALELPGGLAPNLQAAFEPVFAAALRAGDAARRLRKVPAVAALHASRQNQNGSERRAAQKPSSS